MLLTDAIASVRTLVGDTGLFLTFTSGGPDASGQAVLHVADLAKVAPGMAIVIGSGLTAEGHLIVSTSGATGAGTVTLATNLVNTIGNNTPVGLGLLTDDEITEAVRQGVIKYSMYRPLTKRYPVTAPNTVPGLLVVASQDTYTLPADWVEPDRDTFDRAFGIKSDMGTAGGFYAQMYAQDNRFSGVTPGQTSNFGTGSAYGFAPINGNPADNPNSGLVAGSAPTYTIVRGTPPQLVILPMPTVGGTYDFFYKALHTAPTVATASSVPAEDALLPLKWATYLVCQALATRAAKLTEHKAASETVSYARAPQFYRDLGQDARKEFEAVLMYAANGISG